MVVPRILIVEDGLGPHPLAAARSFGERGWTVGIGSPTSGGRAASSRWVSSWHQVPPAEVDTDLFLAATAAAVTSGRYDLVFGADDVEVLALSAARDALGAGFPYPAHEVVLHTIDKLELTRAAERAGLATPWTVDADAALSDLPGLPFPVVVKARLHWTPGQRDVPPRLDRVMCTSPAEVATAITTMTAAGGRPIVQEQVHGGLMAITLLMDQRGRCQASLQQVAERISPYWHNSVRAVTVPVQPEVLQPAVRMLADLGWWGLANMQFIPTADGARPRLIDFNGRFYGSLALARAAGLDLPVRWAELALGGETGGPSTARLGVRYQSLEEDVRRAGVQRSGGLIRDLAETLRYASGATHSTWSVADPRPGLRRSRAVVRTEARAAAKRGLRRLLAARRPAG
jgi:predicted ATP-grasp superfamily ATP-dependent carboligase